MTKISTNGFSEMTHDEMENVNGGDFGIGACILIICGVIFVAGVVTGLLGG